MNKEQILNTLSEELYKLDLTLSKYGDTLYAIKRRKIANPLIYFNIDKHGDKYTGSVEIKSINAFAYSPEQIKESLVLLDEVLGGY